MLLALLVHEAGHYIVSRIAGEQIERLELTPFGGVMTYQYASVSHKGIKGLCVHAAGPLSNYAAILVLSASFSQRMLDPSLLRTLIMANLSMLVLNLMPVLPLDGGRMIFCIGYYLFPIAKLVFVLSTLGVLAGVGFVFLALYGLLSYRLLNCSLVIIGFHMTISAMRCRSSLLAENIYTIIQERLNVPARIRRACLYRVAPNTLLLDLIPILGQNEGDISFVFDCGHGDIILREDTVCRVLLQMPSSTIMQAFSCSQEEKKHQNPENASITS